MNLPVLIENLRAHPGMYLNPVTVDNIIIYLQGCDHALHDGLFVGLREWLVLQTGYGANLAWPGLVGELLRNESQNNDDQVMIERLFGILGEYFAVRDTPHGLRRILVDYEMWLRRQEWYTPGSPGWFPLKSPTHSSEQRKSAGTKKGPRRRSK